MLTVSSIRSFLFNFRGVLKRKKRLIKRIFFLLILFVWSWYSAVEYQHNLVCCNEMEMMAFRQEFVDFCIKQLDTHDPLLREGPNGEEEPPYEAALVDFSSKSPHIRYIIQNAIEKLPLNLFSFSVVCSNDNFIFMKEEIQGKLHYPIRIHKLPPEFKIDSVDHYNNLLYTNVFWDFFKEKKKVLLMQDDTFIFKENIQEFLSYDLIGAPWSFSMVEGYDVKVGNGGFSLRSMDLIYEALENKEEILKNLRNTTYTDHLSTHPEDVFFSFAGVYLKKYSIPSAHVAGLFSMENFGSKTNSFGGHQFWNRDRNWKKRLL